MLAGSLSKSPDPWLKVMVADWHCRKVWWHVWHILNLCQGDLHLTEKKEAAMSHRLNVYCRRQQQAFLSWEPGVHKQTSLTVPTSSLHANDPVRAEPLTADFLLQVKHPPPINLLIGDAVIMVTSPGTGPLRRGKKGENVIRCLVKIGRTKAWVDQTRTRTTSDNFTYFNSQKCRCIYKLQSKMQTILFNTLLQTD